MGKTLIYLLLLAILGAGVYFFVFRKDEHTFGASEAGFTISDTASVHQIFMVRTNGTSIDLQRTDSGWMVNHSFLTRPRTVDVFLTTLKKQEAVYPVPENQHDRVLKELAGNGVKVELFDADGKNIRTFYVGSETHEYQGTYMLLEGAKRPYVVQKKNFKGYLSPVYSTDIADWRSRLVLNTAASDIKSAAIQYPLNPVNSFTILQNGGVQLTSDPSTTGGKPLNEQRVKTFLGLFTDVHCEGYLEGVPGIDSVISTMPNFCNIYLTTKQGKEQQVKIFYMPVNKRSKNRATGTPQKYDPDRYYAVFNNNRDTAIIQQHSFGKFFRSPAEFYQADRPVEVNPLKK